MTGGVGSIAVSAGRSDTFAAAKSAGFDERRGRENIIPEVITSGPLNLLSRKEKSWMAFGIQMPRW